MVTMLPFKSERNSNPVEREKMKKKAININPVGEIINKRLESLEKQNLRLQEENSNLIKDYRKSEWFAQIERNHKKRQQTINELRQRLNSLYLEKNND